MPRLFWPNFDFEHELAAGENWQPSQKLRDLNARFAPVLGALCEESDVIVIPTKPKREVVDLGFLKMRFVEEKVVRGSREYSGSDWELVPWGVTMSMGKLAESRGWMWNQPEPQVVKTLNDRLTSFEWERWSQTLPGGAKLIQTERSLLIGIDELPTSRWIVKARFGMSGRERIVGAGTFLTKPQRGWFKKRLAEQGTMILEPFLENAGEVSVLLHRLPEEEMQIVGSHQMITSSHGEYRGNLLSGHDQWQHMLKVIRTHLDLLPISDYFGPLSIDVMRYQDCGGDIQYRAGMDINARWTMGRIASAWWQRSLTQQEGEHQRFIDDAIWLLGDVAASALEGRLPSSMRAIPTCCLDAGGVPSALVVGERLTPALFKW